MLQTILLAIAIPIAVSCVLLLAGWMANRRSERAGLPWWSIAGAVGLGYAAGHFYLAKWPGFPPVDVTHWMPFAAVIAVLGSATELANSRWLKNLVRLIIAAIVAAVVLQVTARTKGAAAIALPAAAALAGSALAIVSLDALERRLAVWEYAVLLLIVAVGIAFGLVLARSALLGQLGGCLAAALGPLLPAAILLRRRALSLQAVLYVFVPVALGLLLIGNQFAYLPPIGAGLLAAAAIVPGGLALIRRTAPMHRGFRWLAIALAILFVAAALFAITRALPPLELDEF